MGSTRCVARALWYTYHGAKRSYPVTNFSPVKQVNINVPWYYSFTCTVSYSAGRVISMTS